MSSAVELARRERVWEVLSDHFLDTETRHEIPPTALTCVEAGLSVAETYDIWRYEVTPAVWPNLWSVAGEWGLFERTWLATEIGRLRGRGVNRPGPLNHVVYRLRVHLNHAVWPALAACMSALIERPPEERSILAADLRRLATHFFDFGPQPFAPEDASRLRALSQSLFLPTFRPLAFCVGDENRSQCERRLEGALQDAETRRMRAVEGEPSP